MPKLRKIPFLVTDAEVDIDGDGQAVTTPFRYYENLLVMLRHAFAQGGLSADDVLNCYQVEEALCEARDAGNDHALLTEEQWRTLKARVDGWRYPRGGKATVEFIRAIRDAEQVEVEAKAAA